MEYTDPELFARVVNRILCDAVREKAAIIRIEAGEKSMVVWLGASDDADWLCKVPLSALPDFFNQVKRMANISAEATEPQRGTFTAALYERDYFFRVETSPQAEARVVLTCETVPPES